jgi:hypothetical protein
VRCLSAEECRSWLAPSGLVLDQYLRVGELAGGTQRPPRYYVIDGVKLPLPDFSRRLLDWMPAGRERLLIVSDWSHYPPDHPHIFETIRKGSGVSQRLAEAPGHVFASTKTDATDYDDRPLIDVEEESVAMWLMSLMLEWTWEGYAVVKGCGDVVWLGDGFIQFFSADRARLDAANDLVAAYGLRPRDTFPWQ